MKRFEPIKFSRSEIRVEVERDTDVVFAPDVALSYGMEPVSFKWDAGGTCELVCILSVRITPPASFDLWHASLTMCLVASDNHPGEPLDNTYAGLLGMYVLDGIKRITLKIGEKKLEADGSSFEIELEEESYLRRVLAFVGNTVKEIRPS